MFYSVESTMGSHILLNMPAHIFSAYSSCFSAVRILSDNGNSLILVVFYLNILTVL